jgi:hypothetical protein
MGFRRRLSADNLVGMLVVALVAAPVCAFAQSSTRTIYCCDDARGRPVCGDILPAACYGQAYREISPQGMVRRHVAAPLTPGEVVQRDAEAQRQREEEARLFVQRRLDEALLETFTGLADIDLREERALAEVDRSMVSVREREVELAEQRFRYAKELEFYAGRTVPHDIQTALRLIDAELSTYSSLVAAKEAEKDAIRARFAGDRRRYAELIASGAGKR